MAVATRPFRIAQVLLTIGVLEFFGPIVRDTSVTHLLNPTWVGHARFHLMWTLVFMGLSGLCCLYLIWGRRPLQVSNLYVALLWQACNIFGFWGAALLQSRYGGAIIDPEFHLTILGLNENIFAFVVLTALLVGTFVFLKTRVEPVS
jgi:phosphate/sulfate permease